MIFKLQEEMASPSLPAAQRREQGHRGLAWENGRSFTSLWDPSSYGHPASISSRGRGESQSQSVGWRDSCVTWDKSLNLSGSQCPGLQKADNNIQRLAHTIDKGILKCVYVSSTIPLTKIYPKEIPLQVHEMIYVQRWSLRRCLQYRKSCSI